jgi:dTMP kinase
MQPKGCFITFEGGEGAGKSTQAGLLATRLRASGRTVRIVREPGGTELGEDVRRILKHAPYGARLCAPAELLLFAASRAQLVAEVIRPALQAGETVLCDRFTDSSAAYQGAGRRLPRGIIDALNNFATAELVPDLTVLLDLPAAAGLARARQRAATQANPAGADRLEALDTAFYERVRAAYLDIAAREPGRVFVVDAAAAPEEIAGRVWARVDAATAAVSAVAATANGNPSAAAGL